MQWLIWAVGVLLQVCILTVGEPGDGIEMMALDKFPKEKISHHFGCKESQEFATNCACHIKCDDATCANARSICKKYSGLGCKYMLTRKVRGRKLATLKRVAVNNESAAYDVSIYPKTDTALQAYPNYARYASRRGELNGQKSPTGTKLGELVSEAGKKGEEVMDALMSGSKKAASNSLWKSLLREAQGSTSKTNYCGNLASRDEEWKKKFLEYGISLVALSYRSPMSLVNSMRTWKKSGLLDMVQEKKIILNDPLPQDIAIALEHDFQIIEPNDISGVKTSKDNVVTIGAGFYYALQHSPNSEYLLFLENDFKIDTEMGREDIMSQLVAAAGMLERGAQIVRLQSRKAKGCGTFKECGHAFRPSSHEGGLDRKRNWYSFYCPNYNGTQPYVDNCLDVAGGFRCFTSWDSNWSVNAIFVKRSTFMNKKYQTPRGQQTIPEVGLQNNKVNDGFERQMGFGYNWMNWKVPVCLAMEGLFIHYEIETGA